MLRNFVLLVALALMVAGCGTSLPASVRGGECKVFTAPKYAPVSNVADDQEWIDETVESGVGGCGWERPKKRPKPTPAAKKVTIRAVKIPLPLSKPQVAPIDLAPAPLPWWRQLRSPAVEPATPPPPPPKRNANDDDLLGE